MRMRAFVTGGTGFVGTHLCRFLMSSGYEVATAAVAPRRECLSSTMMHFGINILDQSRLKDALAQFRPDEVYHLAALSSVPQSRENLRATYEVNVVGTFNVLEAVRQTVPEATVLNVSTAQVYAETDAAIEESFPIRPGNPYAASKAMAELLASQYAHTEGVKVVTVRSFNHTGPGQSADFVLSAFALQIARIAAGLQQAVVTTGELEVERDFTDVRDVVRAYNGLLRQPCPGEIYNVCSGRAYSLSWLLLKMKETAGVEFAIRRDPGRTRPAQPRRLCGNPAKILSHTGWQTAIPLHQTLKDLLVFWRSQVACGVEPSSVRSHPVST